MLDLLRKIIGMMLTVAAVIAIVGLCITGQLVFGPLIDAFKNFTWQGVGQAINDLFTSFGIPLVMFMLGLIGWSFDDSKSK